MDFVSLAEATSPSNLRRLLSTITNNNNNNNNNNSDSNDEDDDFSHLDTRTHSHSHSHTGLSTQQLNNDIGGGGIGGGTTGDDFLVNAKSPMFSPAAEAELFMLATNFLLCTFLL
jgi:hypothetical protein